MPDFEDSTASHGLIKLQEGLQDGKRGDPGRDREDSQRNREKRIAELKACLAAGESVVSEPELAKKIVDAHLTKRGSSQT